MRQEYSFKIELAIALAICVVANFLRGHLYALIAWIFNL